MKARAQFLMRRFLRACPSLIKRRVEENHLGEILLLLLLLSLLPLLIKRRVEENHSGGFFLNLDFEKD